MAASPESFKKTIVTTENCVLHITTSGSGSKLFVLIPGGHGTCSGFYPVLQGLEDSGKYTVATYDRRGHGASRFSPDGGRINGPINPAQSARDVLAVMRHLGFEVATIFGTSLGGVLALEFGVHFPQHVDKLIAHESPTMVLLPGQLGQDRIDWCYSVFNTYKTKGSKEAMVEFLAMTVGWRATASGEGADIPPPQTVDEVVMDEDHEWWFENETMIAVYTPNLWELRAHLSGKYKDTMSCAVTAGDASKDAPYALTTYVHRDITGCQHHAWPGGHLLYMVDPNGFVKAMLETLEKLERK